MSDLETLNQILKNFNPVVLAMLFGSRAKGTSHDKSDWDIAVLFDAQCSETDCLKYKEELRERLCQVFQLAEDRIDIVDLRTAPLSLLSSIVEEGIVVKGDDTIELIQLYRRVWGLEEDFYWRHRENRNL